VRVVKLRGLAVPLLSENSANNRSFTSICLAESGPFY
jgi:hypothetical protein